MGLSKGLQGSTRLRPTPMSLRMPMACPTLRPCLRGTQQEHTLLPLTLSQQQQMNLRRKRKKGMASDKGRLTVSCDWLPTVVHVRMSLGWLIAALKTVLPSIRQAYCGC